MEKHITVEEVELLKWMNRPDVHFDPTNPFESIREAFIAGYRLGRWPEEETVKPSDTEILNWLDKTVREAISAAMKGGLRTDAE
jgi:hypothetical protein